MYEKKLRVGIEAQVEAEGREGVEYAQEAGLKHRVDEVVHEVLPWPSRYRW
jgi:hypothetical protein